MLSFDLAARFEFLDWLKSVEYARIASKTVESI